MNDNVLYHSLPGGKPASATCGLSQPIRSGVHVRFAEDLTRLGVSRKPVWTSFDTLESASFNLATGWIACDERNNPPTN